MNQENIGKFIAEMRKECNMTQKQLAEKLGISDKTVSKWECGNGMPDLEIIIPLCQNLNITLNELLTGERLSHNNYTKNAEENIMNLLKEKKEIEGKNKLAKWQGIVAIVLFLAVLIFMKATDHYHFTSLFDFTNIVVFVILIAMTFCVLLGAGLHKYFLLGLKYSISKSPADSEADLTFAIQAFRLAEKSLIYTGLFAGAFYMIVWSKAMDDPWIVGPYFRISVLNICYGMLGGLIMLLIRNKLQKKLSGTSL